MLVPKLTYVMIQYEDEAAVPEFTATLGQKPIEGLGFETFCDNVMIKVKDLKELGADGLRVTGGAYKLMLFRGQKPSRNLQAARRVTPKKKAKKKSSFSLRRERVMPAA